MPDDLDELTYDALDLRPTRRAGYELGACPLCDAEAYGHVTFDGIVVDWWGHERGCALRLRPGRCRCPACTT